jgi:hypothetical protein
MAQIFCGCNKEQREERKGKERENLQSRGRLTESVESSQTATQSTMDALEHGANRILCVSSEAIEYCRSAAPVSRGVHHGFQMNVL